MRKAAVLLIILIVFMPAALMIRGKMDRENMGKYEYTKDMLGIAVARVMKSEAVIHNFGRPIYPADRELQYTWVYIKLVNSGSTATQIEPGDFTLSIPGKTAVSYDTKATNSMQKCLKPITLEPDKQAIGVLIFPLPGSSTYSLHYNGPGGKVEKRLVID
ncbi:MAG TPA: DUF4352 domain-containing protein [Clostridia bacterium]|nr:DUF4352 domain-containing protein [Clostridia bacterium]